MFYDSLATWVQKKYFLLHLLGFFNGGLILVAVWQPRPLDLLGKVILTGFFAIFGLLFPSLYLIAFRSLEKSEQPKSRENGAAAG